jgi:hypothetical protein
MFLAAAPAVVMPTAWMRAIAAWHAVEVPEAPLVEYLTRSMSALYVMFGVTYWYMSCDVRRYLPLLRFSIWVMFAFDATVIVLDVLIPMPILWTAGEAVALTGWTLLFWWLVRRVERHDS